MTIILCTASCTDENLVKSGTQTEMSDFSLQEAKEYFQIQAKENLILSRSLDNKENRVLSPGDFVPNWDAAVGASMNGLACYDIPIAPTYRFKAISVDERHGMASAGKVNVYQKLLIVKDVKNTRMSQYILTLIPSKSYDNRNGAQTCTNFINCADKGGFTGVAIYSCVYSQITARVSIYKNGIRTKGVFLLGATGKADLAEKYELARLLVSTITLQKGRSALTRGEDNYDPTYDGGWIDEVIITPEPDYDFSQENIDNEKWLEETRPTGNVDPEPEIEYPPTPEDSADPPSNTNDTYDIDPRLEKALKGIAPILKLKGIDISKYNIVLGKDQCPVNAQTTFNNTIEICPEFYKNGLNERASIIWHEIYHIEKGHNQTNSATTPCDDLRLYPTEKIQEGLNCYLEWRFQDLKDIPQYDEILKGESEFMCTEYKLRNDPEWYANEIETYAAEKNNDIEKSDYYDGFTDFMLWKFEQLYEYTKNDK